MQSPLIEPHGGQLVDLLVDKDRNAALRTEMHALPFWHLTQRQLNDVELLMTGGFSPLRGFLCQADYENVCRNMRLSDGTLWPIPIMLDVTEALASQLQIGDRLSLLDPEGVVLAIVNVRDIWRPDTQAEAEYVFGTANPEHPGVANLLRFTNPVCIGGHVEGLQLPRSYEFPALRLTPASLRNRFSSLGWTRVAAFQTRNPMHRAHYELTVRASAAADAKLLIHPVVGVTPVKSIELFTRIRCYLHVMKRYHQDMAMLALLPLAMRMAGPREAVWHAIIRKNYGCTHFIVGRDHAGPVQPSNGKPFYDCCEAQELLAVHEEEIGIQMIRCGRLVFLPSIGTYTPIDEVPAGSETRSISGTELRQRLDGGRDIPTWFSFPEVVKELQRTCPPRHQQGFTVLFTGLPSSGKSTLANLLIARLMQTGERRATLLDGDHVRRLLSSELGFSKAHRDINIRRIGWVASEITKMGGIAVCAPIAPYDAVRKELRKLITSVGGFMLVHVSTPLDVCEQRDCKGLYAKARAGIITNFTGISDPFEAPDDAEVTIDTTSLTPDQCVEQILLFLTTCGYIQTAPLPNQSSLSNTTACIIDRG